jgi:pSer/pThr/pTyr-binding forkhead associated (FHA) protein
VTLGTFQGKQHSVTIPDLNVSKSHCKFTYEDCGYWLTDTGSTNGTWLNKKQLKKDKCRQVMNNSKYGSSDLFRKNYKNVILKLKRLFFPIPIYTNIESI